MVDQRLKKYFYVDYTNVYSEGDFQHVQIDDITLDHKEINSFEYEYKYNVKIW